MTCGEELAASAEVPEAMARLMSHVAVNLEAHAAWVGASPDGEAEREALLVVARGYRGIAGAAERVAGEMRSRGGLRDVRHDPARLDRIGLARWMRVKLDLQEELAALLTRHAAASRAALVALDGASAGANPMS